MDNKTNSGYLYSDNAENHCYSEEDFMSFEFLFILRIKDKPEWGGRQCFLHTCKSVKVSDFWFSSQSHVSPSQGQVMSIEAGP